MRKEEERAAAAAKELLKAAASRERRAAAAASSRKGKGKEGATKGQKSVATTMLRKGKEGGLPAADQKRSSSSSPMQMASTGAAPVSELSPSPVPFTGPSPTSYSGAGGSCYFNGAGGYFNGAGAFFNGTAPQTPNPFMFSQCSDPATWDSDPIPSGGFTNFMQPHLSQNFHFVGASSHRAPFKPPQQQHMESPTSEEETPMEIRDSINVDSDDEAPRLEKRILWTPEEDLKLMSSWLHNSTDPSIGADRKNEQYWYDVVGTYNETTPSHRRRNAKQAKDRWHKVNKWTDLFHNAWVKARRIYTSGYNDQMWIEKAHVFYVEDNKILKLGRFVLLDVWLAVRNEAKWVTYNKGLKEQRKRKSGNIDNEGVDPEDTDPDVDEQPRPIGQKKAKQAAREKKEPKDNGSDLEELDKFGKIQSEEHANRLKVLEVQAKLSSEKIEQAKLHHLAAIEQKEAAEVQREAKKLEVEARMFETYNNLLSVNVSLMSAEEKQEHAATIKFLKKKLFAIP